MLFVRLSDLKNDDHTNDGEKKKASYKYLWLAVILSLWCAAFSSGWMKWWTKRSESVMDFNGIFKLYATHIKRSVTSERLVCGWFFFFLLESTIKFP